MTENPAAETACEPIAIVGMACRFPEAADLAQMLDLVVTGRRAFRALPPVRLDVADYGEAELGEGEPVIPGLSGPTPMSVGSARAALLEGWRFDRAAFGVTQPGYRAADPAHWLALETAARALADGGFPGGQGLTRDRTGVIIGNTLTGEVSRATAMRSRWPYIRRVLRAALAAGDIPADRHADVIGHAAAGFLGPLWEAGDVLAGSLPGAIADRICGHFGFRGGGHAVDAAHSSSLLAITAACSALAAGDLDAVVAGGVDISLDPFEYAGLAATGALATGEMRVFDARPTGFWPGEGCGLVVLMRAAGARAAGVPAYAQIAGWGVSSAGSPALTRPGSASLLLALRRAYQRAQIDPADVQLIEGDGTGTASGDLAELTSLAELRQGAGGLAALGSVKANIGHTKAAAGAASLLKATLAISAGVIPPATGCVRPHPLIAGDEARLRAPRAPEPWPERARLAGVSSVGTGGTSVHVVLRRAREGRRRRVPGGQGPAGASQGTATLTAVSSTPGTEVFAFSAAGIEALAAELGRVAELAPWLSDGELHDLACQAGRREDARGPARAGLVAASQDQLARLARDAAGLLPGLRRGALAVSPGVYLADGARGRVTLLLPGEGSSVTSGLQNAAVTGDVGTYDPALQPGLVAASLAGLRWLDALGVSADAAIGHGLGEITGLVWAGCLTEPEAARLVAQRAALLATPPPPRAERTAMVCVDVDGRQAEELCASTGLAISAHNGPRCHVLAGPLAVVREATRRLTEEGIPARLLDSPHGFYSPAMADRVPPLRAVLREFSFQPPARRLISTITGADLTAADDVAALLCAQLTSPVSFAGPLTRAAADCDLLVETGPGDGLSRIAADCCEVPAVSLGAARGSEGALAEAAAALFAAGAVGSLRPLFAARPARPVDIWRERVFIPSPCGAPPVRGTVAGSVPTGSVPTGSVPTGSVPTGSVPSQPSGPAPAGAAHHRPAQPTDSARAAPSTSAASTSTASTSTASTSTASTSTASTSTASTGAASTSAGREPAATPAAANGAHASPPAPASPGTHRASPAGRPASARPAPGPAAISGRPSRHRLPGDQDGARAGADAVTTGPAPAAAHPDRAAPGPAPYLTDSVAPWVRCFTEELADVQRPTAGRATGPWRLRLAAAQTSQAQVASVFADDAGADTVLAVVGDPAEPGACGALLEAARQAQQTGRLVVVTATAGLTGFCASLQAEHPGVGVTLIRAPLSPKGLLAARPFAAARPGRFRELVIDEAGTAAEPAMRLNQPAADGTFPFGPADVVLVSGITQAGDLACATALASRGAALAVIAAPGPDDPRLAAHLAELRAAGVRVGRKKADLTDPGQVAAAVRSLERGLGPVTAVVHAPAPGPVERCSRLSDSALRNYLVNQRTRLSNVLSSVAEQRLRVLVTFGRAAARYGSVGGCCEALAGGLLAEHAARLAAGRPRCLALHVDWAPWDESTPTTSGQAGAGDAAPIPVAEAAELLLTLLTSTGPPHRVAVHGRLRADARAAILAGPGKPALKGRFLAAIREHYPGVELVAETRLSLVADPYLEDYRIDGLAVLPAAMALEAMAQAASALAGSPHRQARDVSLAAPVVLPAGQAGGETVIRVCALSRGNEVETVLRCGQTLFRVDHARAVFRPGGGQDATGETGPAVAAERPRIDTSPGGDPPTGGDAPSGGMVDGTDLYGPVYFQAGRFRRVAFLPEVTSTGCRALVRGGDSSPWFGPVPGPVDMPLNLGSPGLNDATLHVLQACRPHRRLLPSRCESVHFSGQEVRGALRVKARLRRDTGAGTGQQESTWDVVAADATGEAVVTWTGLRVRDVGPLAHTAAWHPALLANVLEARASELGIDDTLRAVINSGRPVPPVQPSPDAGAPAPALTWADTARGRGTLDGLELKVTAARPVACRWEAVGGAAGDQAESDEGLQRLRQQLDGLLREGTGARQARLATIAACLAALGREPGSGCQAEAARDGGWIAVRSPGLALACTVTDISGVPSPVAIALASRAAPHRSRPPVPGPEPGQDWAVTANGSKP
jgi:enediyne polyketide synthase